MIQMDTSFIFAKERRTERTRVRVHVRLFVLGWMQVGVVADSLDLLHGIIIRYIYI